VEPALVTLYRHYLVENRTLPLVVERGGWQRFLSWVGQRLDDPRIRALVDQAKAESQAGWTRDFCTLLEPLAGGRLRVSWVRRPR
jgi:hypothetical protein